MAKKKEIRFAGFGGQGIVLAGYIIGKAVSIYEKKHAIFTQSYGPEARGGACSADIIISGSKIYFPKVQEPDVLVLMSEEAYHTYSKNIADSSIVIIDEDLVKITDGFPKNVTLYSIPATQIAEDMGRKIIANIVMLGYFTAKSNLVSYESVKQSILSSVPKGTEELNINAFDKGYFYIEKMEA